MYGRRPTITSVHGMVAAAHPLAAQAGARLLASGGNAFDAAVATAAALNVVEPYMSSLAGQGLATVYSAKDKRVRCLDFVPRMPRKFPVDKLSSREQLQRGAIGTGVPGNFGGWAELVKAYGTKPLSEILAPAVALARDGYPLIEFNIYETNEARAQLAAHPDLYPEWVKTYTFGRGSVELGELLKQDDLAKTLDALGKEGPGLLYGGTLGKAIVARLTALGGVMEMADLEAFKPIWREPLTVAYRGLDISCPPPPCEGFQFSLTMRILEGFDLARLPRNGVEHLDIVWRAIRLAAGVRLAHNGPSPERLAEMLSDANVAKLRARVEDGKPIVGPTEQWTAPASTGAADQHTTSFSIADKAGNLVCITQSIGSPFGSGVIVPGTGLCLNNFLYWSDVNPKSPNRATPGGDLHMCVTPTISMRGKDAVLALGTPGSYGILQTQVQALVQHLDYGLPLQDAIEAPRARLWDGAIVEPEARFEQPVLDQLRRRGHAVTPGEPWTMRVGGMQAVSRDPKTGILVGACDPRRDGYVATP
ncbi:MAG TPA: gamma-glutamyltransferase [Hyphomicrobiaceae bacterium]|nr:gamma-glutamyltransferase [Hyphomicrobiaceae bacterium]